MTGDVGVCWIHHHQTTSPTDCVTCSWIPAIARVWTRTEKTLTMTKNNGRRTACVASSLTTHAAIATIGFVCLLLLVGIGGVKAQELFFCTEEEIFADACDSASNLICEANTTSACPARSDCLDCDPCMQYRGTDCQTCTSAGCHWCAHSNPLYQSCHSPEIAQLLPDSCAVTLNGYVSSNLTCPSKTCAYLDGQLVPDTCFLAFDGICDQGTTSVADGGDGISETCGFNTDCFDCDPCHDNDFTTCEQCTADGNCNWCSLEGTCFAKDKTWTAGARIRLNGDMFVLTCQAQDYAFAANECAALEATNVFADPLYDANQWIFDLIDVEPVWRQGICKSLSCGYCVRWGPTFFESEARSALLFSTDECVGMSF